jgi:hypothetical protein
MEVLEKMKTLLGNGAMALGAIIVVFGLIQVGLSIREASSGGGAQLAVGIASIVGGAIIIAASFFFKGIDISWVTTY